MHVHSYNCNLKHFAHIYFTYVINVYIHFPKGSLYWKSISSLYSKDTLCGILYMTAPVLDQGHVSCIWFVYGQEFSGFMSLFQMCLVTIEDIVAAKPYDFSALLCPGTPRVWYDIFLPVWCWSDRKFTRAKTHWHQSLELGSESHGSHIVPVAFWLI